MKTVRWVFFGIAFLIAFSWMKGCIVSCRERAQEKAKIEKEGKMKNPPPQSQSAPIHVLTSRIFDFDQTGVIHEYLKPGWKDYPKGGKIKIETPLGRTLYDEPGVQNNFGMQPEGWYTISKVEQKTTGVELYNYWE